MKVYFNLVIDVVLQFFPSIFPHLSDAAPLT
jgi:hypothetical protein